MQSDTISLDGKTILVTGAAGFIGANFVKRLFSDVKNVKVIGIDSITDYYDVNIKYERLKEIEDFKRDWVFVKGSIAEKKLIEDLFSEYRPAVVVNLAAQAGVRYSITNPDAYVESNLIGFYNILETCRHHKVEHLVYASSSSVYGSNIKQPYSTEDKTDSPLTLYAATKKSNELMAHAYSQLFDIPSSGIRFFTVYGPAGRPDMAYFKFSETLRKGETIRIFNYGNCKRDFTYIDDAIESLMRIIARPPKRLQPAGTLKSAETLLNPPFRLYNVGKGAPDKLMDFVLILQKKLKEEGVLPSDFILEEHVSYEALQPGDALETYADTSALDEAIAFTPQVSLDEGLGKFAKWYAEYCK